MKKFFVIILVVIFVFLYINDDLIVIKDYIYNYATNDLLYDDSNKEKDSDYKGDSNDNKSYEANYNNYGSIEMGEDVSSVIDKMGEPNSKLNSEYNFKWYVYNEDYNKFAMVGIEDQKVVALFSNTMNSCESENIKLDDNKENILKEYKPQRYRLIRNTKYNMKEDYYNLFIKNNKYITVFYDSFEDNKVMGIQIVSKKCEDKLTGIYPKNKEDIYDFEALNRYIINSERAKRKLSLFSYSKKATSCARSHSLDMRDEDYFAHEDLNNRSPFDRMEEYNINFRSAAENIAAGQSSSIFAHYALMNSSGHRINLLGDYKYIGVGIVLGGSYSVYYTQNFYSL